MKTLLSACVLIVAGATAQAADISSGSGVVIGAEGEILTNAHVVEACTEINVRFPSFQKLEAAVLVARDERNDLAVIRTPTANITPTSVAIFREGTPVRAGDAVVALGYPLSGLLASTSNMSVGNVSALAGLNDDSRYLQISAPVQPGNSGGPLLDATGHLVGIVTAKLNWPLEKMAYDAQELLDRNYQSYEIGRQLRKNRIDHFMVAHSWKNNPEHNWRSG